jgi:myo-inositol-1(or 4)-monophosphatase
MNLSLIGEQVIGISKSTASFISSQHIDFKPEKVEKKGRNDFVSYVDKTSEKMLVEGLSRLLPEAGFITEENTRSDRGKAYTWIIDPLDGTTNFIHGLFPFAISIALMEKDKIVMGLVHEIGLNEIFYADLDSPASVNGKPICCSGVRRVEDALIATGFPYNDFLGMPGFIKSLEHFMHHSHGLRRLGSAATDLAYVAAGRFDAFFEYGLQPWDVAAGAFILERAGGRNADFQRGDNWLFGNQIISANSEIFDEFSLSIQGFFPA